MSRMSRASPAANQSTALTLMSLSSWPPWAPGGGWGSLLMSRLRQERGAAKVMHEPCQPKPADAEHRERVHPVQAKARGGEKGRHRRPEQVHESHDEKERRHGCQPTGVLLDVPRQQEQERHREVQQEQGHADRLPAALQSLEVVRNLLRQVARPDEQ